MNLGKNMDLSSGVTIQNKGLDFVKNSLASALKGKLRSKYIQNIYEQCEGMDGIVRDEHTLIKDEGCGCKKYVCIHCGRKYIP